MKRPRFMGILLWLSLLALPATWAELVFESREIEIPVEIGDKTGEAVFKFQNRGSEPIEITDTRSSCGCTAAVARRGPIAPGTEGELTAVFTFGSRQGIQEKHIRVLTSDGKSQQLVLRANIPVAMTLEPRLLTWQHNELADARKFSVVLWSSDDWEVEILEPLPTGYSVDLLKEEGNRLTFTVKTTDEPAGRMSRLNLRAIGPDEKVSNQTLYLIRR